MKRTCYCCKALMLGQRLPPRCGLGYKIEYAETTIKPISQCPKPLTNKALCDIVISKGGKQ